MINVEIVLGDFRRKNKIKNPNLYIRKKILEFNKVKYLLNYDGSESLASVELLAQAHFNLGITYAKMELYNQAEQEILNALSLIPNKEYRDVLNMVRSKIQNQESSNIVAP